jgi:hypothetical protein
MNSLLARSVPDRRSSSEGRILMIEPDAGRASLLRELLGSEDGIDVRIVTSAADAIRSIGDEVPDLVMTSTFLPPAEEAALADHIKETPSASHLQIINVPYFIDGVEPAPEPPRSRMRRLLRRRAVPPRPRCDRETLRKQIKEYLEHATRHRRELDDDPLWPGTAVASKPGLWLATSRPSSVALVPAQAMDSLLLSAEHRDRRRARRRRSSELPSLWAIRLPSGSDAKVVDISTRGVLLESASKIAPGSTVDLQVLGEETNVLVPSRAVRTDVAAVDGCGVRYHIAAAFSRELDLVGLERPSQPPPSPRALGEILSRVLAEVDGPPHSASVRARFESELRALLRVRDVQIRETPLIAERGLESIYFTVPHAPAGSAPILQVVFDPDGAPSAPEFRLLKAAATLAAVVLTFAPPRGDGF